MISDRRVRGGLKAKLGRNFHLLMALATYERIPFDGKELSQVGGTLS
jgi:hypothetical protein